MMLQVPAKPFRIFPRVLIVACCGHPSSLRSCCRPPRLGTARLCTIVGAQRSRTGDQTRYKMELVKPFRTFPTVLTGPCSGHPSSLHPGTMARTPWTHNFLSSLPTNAQVEGRHFPQSISPNNFYKAPGTPILLS